LGRLVRQVIANVLFKPQSVTASRHLVRKSSTDETGVLAVLIHNLSDRCRDISGLEVLSTTWKSTDGTAGFLSFPMLVRGDASAFARLIFLE
jgi:hypothetical protein